MSDPRLTPFSGRVADISLRGRIRAERHVAGAPCRIRAAVADLLDAPAGKRQRQAIYGETVRVYDRADAYAFVQLRRDGYVGWVRDDALGPELGATHLVAGLATHAYSADDIKSPERLGLPFGARVSITQTRGRFGLSDAGWIPMARLKPLDERETDPVALMRRFLGVPYLWGGNTPWGIDCSGLVQAVCLACGVACPADSDMQAEAFAPARGPARAGDLWFWKGHVAMVSRSGRLIHANAHHMAVTEEPADVVIARIRDAGEGEITARLRPDWPQREETDAG